ncbi:MAG: hypothetical protein HCA25_07815 [Dolichospermum sp. DET50]|nr:hypothetical protein [Dolichospermum sp. DET66]MBS3032190.1 hypothetical protein [Dolichospermum sp. DET67]MBS3037394.1 hypothetical protein [Dolichospermum sp. DET50]QSX69377.1 MAG: hypothetical protein EZY12_07040 [Dolichospermum sp. DET69]
MKSGLSRFLSYQVSNNIVFELKNQESGVRSQESGVRSQEPGVNEPRRDEGHEGRRKRKVGQLVLEVMRLFLVQMPDF